MTGRKVGPEIHCSFCAVANGVNPQFITRTWQATDCCANSATCSQTVTVFNP